jgi:glyoxylase-like metal-dependent hydrolase (beta-lactamase superfamily II)
MAMNRPNAENSRAGASKPEEPGFEKGFAGRPGEVTELSPLLRRVLAPNPSPFTFHGTNSYIVGRRQVAVIDPGPDDAGHVARLIAAVRGETVSHIVITHTHRDHSPAARALAAATGAPIVGCAPYAATGDDGAVKLDASHDGLHAPAQAMRSGDAVSGPGWTLEALHTPGHTSNHLCFVLDEEKALLSGDHVMAWSTSIVAPPDGVMADYMASLEKLRGRAEDVYWPGHGGPVTEPQRFVRGLISHRRQRESAILKRLAEGDRTIAAMVPVLYAGVPTILHPAAARSVFAHLIDLVGRGVVATGGAPSLDGEYRLA